MNSELVSHIVITVKKQYLTRIIRVMNSELMSRIVILIFVLYCGIYWENGALLYHINYKISEIL